MGKKSNNQKKGANYFNLQFQQLGDGWTGRITTLDVRKSAIRLFKDIANGNIDLEKDIQYFNEPSFTWNLKLAADDNAYANYSEWLGMSYIPNKDPVQEKICDEHYVRSQVYSVISQTMNNVLTGISINGGLQTSQLIGDLSIYLRDYRYVFNGNYFTITRPDDGKLKVERREKHGKDTAYRSTGPAKGFPNPRDM